VGARDEAVMVDRRAALQVVASILGMQAGRVTPRGTCPLPDTLTVDFGAGACTVRQILLVQGALTARVDVQELLASLNAKTGGD
jgi:hypothetical protein